MRLSTATSPLSPYVAPHVKQPWGHWTGVKLHAVVVSVVALSLPILEDPSSTLILGGILCLPTYIALGLVEARRSPLWLSPLSFYLFWYSVGLGVSAIYLGYFVSSGEGIRFSLVYVPPDDVAAGYVIFLVGSVALHAGLQLYHPARFSSSVASGPDVNGVRLESLILLWAIGLWVLWEPVWFAAFGPAGRSLRWASVTAISAFVLLPREHFRLSSTGFKVLFMIGTAGLFVANIMSGSKAYIMFSFLPLIWLMLMRRHLRSWLPVVGPALLMFYFFVVAPIVTVSRYAPLQEDETTASHILEAYDAWVAGDLNSANDHSFQAQLDGFLNRHFDPIAVGYLNGEVKRDGLQLGDTMTYAAYVFIPRLVWPDKPSIDRGAWFSAYTGASASEQEATESLGMSATGELYWNFGIIGVMVGMFSLGCMFGGLWRMAGADPRQKPLRLLLYILVMLHMPNMSEAIMTASSIVGVYLTFKAAFIATAKMHRVPKASNYVANPSS